MQLRVVREGRWRVLAVCRERGDCPFFDFLDHLPPNLAKDGRRMLALLGHMADQGPPRNVEVSHQVAAGLWELVRGRLRVLWFHDHGRMVVLTHGFVKRTRKAPAGEIARAAAWQARYRGAKAAGDLIVEEDG